MDGKGLLVGQQALAQIQPNAEEAQIAPIRAVHQVAQPILDRPRAGDQQIQIEQHDRQGQALQMLDGLQARGFQVKAVVLQIAKGGSSIHIRQR